MNNKGALGFGAIVGLAVAALILIFGGGGIIKFLVSDKTPLIILGAFIFLILFSRKKRLGRI